MAPSSGRLQDLRSFLDKDGLKPFPNFETVRRNRDICQTHYRPWWDQTTEILKNQNHEDFDSTVEQWLQHDRLPAGHSNYFKSPYHRRPTQRTTQTSPSPPSRVPTSSTQVRPRPPPHGSRSQVTMRQQEPRPPRVATETTSRSRNAGISRRQTRPSATKEGNKPHVRNADLSNRTLANRANRVGKSRPPDTHATSRQPKHEQRIHGYTHAARSIRDPHSTASAPRVNNARRHDARLDQPRSNHISEPDAERQIAIRYEPNPPYPVTAAAIASFLASPVYQNWLVASGQSRGARPHAQPRR